MGTGKSGRYLNTSGSSRTVSDFSLVHSSEGTFKKSQVKANGITKAKLRLASGGHGEAGIKLLEKYKIPYNITKTYPNGVRVGNIPSHANKAKRTGEGQAWFPKSWSNKDIRHAGEHVAGLKENRRAPDGKKLYGVWKGVRVIVIKTNGKIASVFPDSDQNVVIKKKKGKK